jgi:hypothetical protein
LVAGEEALTAGEQRGIYTRVMVLSDGAHVPHMDPIHTGLSRILAYLVDWSLIDEDGKKVAILDRSRQLRRNPARRGRARRRGSQGSRTGKKREGWREQVVSDLVICRTFHWRYDDVLDASPCAWP